MSEATVFENDIPTGWYEDPAKPGMERWWSGSEWSDHVRYSDGVKPSKPRALEAVTASQPVFAPEPSYAFAAQPSFEKPQSYAFDTQPSFAQLSIAAPTFQPPVAPAQPAFAQLAIAAPTFEPPVASAQVAPAQPEFAFSAAPAFGATSFDARSFGAPSVITAPTHFEAPASFTHFSADVPAAPRDFGGARLATIPAINTHVPMVSLDMGVRVSTQFHDMRRFTPSTVGSWLLAFSPLIWMGLILLGGMLSISPLLVSGALATVLLVAALTDHATLSRRGLQTASVGWFFLGVLPYLVVRLLVLRREGVQHMSPAVAFVASMGASVAIALYLPALLSF